ncbi:PREDICTED: uncharacterized protein LOC101295700 [Fragaria vesca subsp. vesca]
MAEPKEWIPRLESAGKKIPDYDNPDYFSIKVYYGGYIDHISGTYIGGSISYYDNVDKDKMSLTEVDGMVRGINCAYGGQMIDYWYSIGGEDNQKTKLNNDSDTITMCCRVPEIRLDGKRYKRLANKKWLPGVKISEPQESVLTQASRAPNINPTDKGKGKLKVELSKSDNDSDAGLRVQDDDVSLLAYEDRFVEEDEDDECGGDANEDSEDDDYDPAKDDDDLTKAEIGEKNEDGGSSAAAAVSSTLTVEGTKVEDSEAMYEAVDSNEEVIGHELNSDDDGEGHQ